MTAVHALAAADRDGQDERDCQDERDGGDAVPGEDGQRSGFARRAHRYGDARGRDDLDSPVLRPLVHPVRHPADRAVHRTRTVRDGRHVPDEGGRSSQAAASPSFSLPAVHTRPRPAFGPVSGPVVGQGGARHGIGLSRAADAVAVLRAGAVVVGRVVS